MKLPLLSIIVLNYNTRDHVLRCLQSIFEHSAGVDQEVIVVDDGSTDGSVAAIQNSFPPVRLIANSQNVGIPRSRNKGLEVSRGEFVFFVDSDMWLVSSACRDSLLKRLKEQPDLGVAGARLMSPQGEWDISCGYRPSLLYLLGYWSFFTSFFPRNRWIRDQYVRQQPREAILVDWVGCGGSMVRRSVFAHAGLYDEKALYGEDMEWCLRARKKGWKVLYEPGNFLIHDAHQSNILWSGKIIDIQEAVFRFYRKHYGFCAEVVARIVTLVGLCIRTSLFRSLSPFPRWRPLHKKATWNQRLLLAGLGIVSAVREDM